MHRYLLLAVLAAPAPTTITIAEDTAMRSIPFRVSSATTPGCFRVDKDGQVLEEDCRFVVNGNSATPGPIRFADSISDCHTFRWSGGFLICADPIDLSLLQVTWEESLPEIHRPPVDQSQDCIDQLWDVVRTSIEVLSGRRLAIKGALARAIEVCE